MAEPFPWRVLTSLSLGLFFRLVRLHQKETSSRRLLVSILGAGLEKKTEGLNISYVNLDLILLSHTVPLCSSSDSGFYSHQNKNDLHSEGQLPGYVIGGRRCENLFFKQTFNRSFYFELYMPICFERWLSPPTQGSVKTIRLL